MSENAIKSYRVTFDRIGRNKAVAPLDAHAADADHLAEQIYRYARPFLISTGVDVAVDLNAMRGGIYCGFANGGTFTIEAVAS